MHLVRDPLPEARRRAPLRVIGFGNAYRSDDSVGLAVARALRGRLPRAVEVLEREGEPTSLVDAWDGAEAVWLVDAVSSSAVPGTIHRFDATTEEVPRAFARSSTHHLGLPEAIELARAVDRLPERLVVYGIDGANFETGSRLSPEVERCIPGAVDAIRQEVLGCIGADA
jgi:hydrogenase maturation protease